MRVFGLTITRTKETPVMSSPSSRGGWWPIAREGFGGAWQRNIEIRGENALSFYAVYACVTLIASDIAKLRIHLMEQQSPDVWEPTTSTAFSPVLAKPNRYQTRIKFIEQWMTSKLVHGNTYVLKGRDARGVVNALYVLDPLRVRPLVAPDGSVYYSLQQDDLAGVKTGVIIPASEIIHDVMVALYHPLCGVSPITACGLSAMTGLRIQNNAASFFANGSQPGGLLTAPGAIAEEDRKIIAEKWASEYTGDNAGKVAVLGNGLKYEPMSVNAVDSQLIEQLKLSAENVCSVFKVPAYMVGVGPTPSYSNVEALNLQYYTQCLQNPIESIEALLDDGLALPAKYGTEFDLDDLLRMDTPSRIKASAEGIGGGGMSPNEARRRFLNLGPVVGGDAPYLQQQNYSLEALAKRDASADPFGKTAADPKPPMLDDEEPDEDDLEVNPPPPARSFAEVRTAYLAAIERVLA